MDSGRRRQLSLLGPLVILSSLLSGCNGESSATPESAENDVVKKYEAAQLPATELELPALDQGRIEVPTPEGWQWASQEKGLLARFHPKGRSGLPQIVVKLDADYTSEVDNVDAETVQVYAEHVQAYLDDKGTKLLEPVKPLLLGENAWARYVQPGKLKNKLTATVERQILRTTHGGRNYIVELQTDADDLTKYRNTAYAVAANIKFNAAVSPSLPADGPPLGDEKSPPSPK